MPDLKKSSDLSCIGMAREIGRAMPRTDRKEASTMKSYDPHSPLIFIHVPKTAGTSV
jgi:hypothetical protein